MNADYKHSNVTEGVIKAAYSVCNSLGAGFLEKVYENALAVELKSSGVAVTQQEPIEVFYRGQLVGSYVADLLVDGKVLVEVKAVSRLDKSHEVQLVNYLKATGVEVGLLLNFGTELQVRRRVFSRRQPSSSA